MKIRTVVRRVVTVGAVIGVFAVSVAALRADELDTAKTRLAKCTAVPDSTLDVIASRLNPKAGGGVLRYGFTVQATGLEGGPWLVSAQLRRPGRVRTAPGDILTWVTRAPGNYASVDTNARKFSDWPRTGDAVPVTLGAAIDSRACVHESRPGNKGLFH